MSSSDDESLPVECDRCNDDRGLCDRPHLEEDRHFNIKLQETFDVETVHNDDQCFFVIKHDLLLLQRIIFLSFTILLAYPMPCKTLCLGEDGF